MVEEVKHFKEEAIPLIIQNPRTKGKYSLSLCPAL